MKICFPLRGPGRMRALALIGLCCLSIPMMSRVAEAGTRHTPREVVVVYNANSDVSRQIAEYYAHKRHVTNILAIHCQDSATSPANESISFRDYSQEIAAPVHRYLAHHKQINFIVLTKGIPIRIDGGETGSRDLNSTGPLHPSVDSYLAATGYSLASGARKVRITGSGATGFVWLNRYWGATVPFSHKKFGGYLVTRLDGLTEKDAFALVDRAVAADNERSLHGTVLLDVQPDFGYKSDVPQPFAVTGDIARESKWSTWNADMIQAGEFLKQRGIPVDLDMSPAFVGDKSDLLGYFSWGSNDSHYRAAAYNSLFFVPGSVGDTAVSTSARTFLPTTGGQSLITVLIAHGITAVKGYVDEPLLQAIASPSILLNRYFSGYSVAESYYAASRFVGWEGVVVGVPLCCSSSAATAR